MTSAYPPAQDLPSTEDSTSPSGAEASQKSTCPIKLGLFLSAHVLAFVVLFLLVSALAAVVGLTEPDRLFGDVEINVAGITTLLVFAPFLTMLGVIATTALVRRANALDRILSNVFLLSVGIIAAVTAADSNAALYGTIAAILFVVALLEWVPVTGDVFDASGVKLPALNLSRSPKFAGQGQAPEGHYPYPGPGFAEAPQGYRYNQPGQPGQSQNGQRNPYSQPYGNPYGNPYSNPYGAPASQQAPGWTMNNPYEEQASQPQTGEVPQQSHPDNYGASAEEERNS